MNACTCIVCNLDRREYGTRVSHRAPVPMWSYPIPTPGWQCPVCSRVWSPKIKSCRFCNAKVQP